MSASPARAADADSFETPNPLDGSSASPDDAADAKAASEGGEERSITAAVVASLSAAPTNWHQATVYFMTTKAEQDREMRRKAPLMFAAGLAMVVVQIFAICGIARSLTDPPCLTNMQCTQAGYYCGVEAKCDPCGQYPPLVEYVSDVLVPGEIFGPFKMMTANGHEFQQINKIYDQSYPHRPRLFFLKRSDTPDGFWGYNFTMVQNRCTKPIQAFSYASEKDDDGNIVMTDRGDLPLEFTHADDDSRSFSARDVRAWCSACVRRPGPDDVEPERLDEYGLFQFDNATGLEVSVMNNKLNSVLAINAMSWLDWCALTLCSYVVGATVVGEIKDTALCAMAAERNSLELSRGWRIALDMLNILRTQVFLLPLMGAIPVLILTQGGSALAVCFNTIAVLFITEVDNMSYHLALGEREKERVDAHGHIVLTDEEAQRISRTKLLCISVTMLYTLVFTWSAAVVLAKGWAFAAVLLFKLSELATTSGLSRRQQAQFVAKAFVAQVCAFRFVKSVT